MKSILYYGFYAVFWMMPLRLKERMVRWLSIKHPDLYKEAARRSI